MGLFIAESASKNSSHWFLQPTPTKCSYLDSQQEVC